MMTVPAAVEISRGHGLPAVLSGSSWAHAVDAQKQAPNSTNDRQHQNLIEYFFILKSIDRPF
jgi:hypothetical protein